MMNILWAIDPISSESSIQEITGQVIKAWASRLNAEVQPVFVCAKSDEALSHSGLQEKAQKKVAEWKTRLEFANLLPLKLIDSAGSDSTDEHVQCLINYAQESKADLIVTSTRAKTGISRWLLGSFAETLALKATLPMLFINPSLDPKSAPVTLDHILFPTDFSDESYQGFRILLPIAKALGSKLEIFHKYNFALSPSLDYAALAGAYISEDTVRAEIKASTKCGNLWAEEARQLGVNAQFNLIDTPYKSVTEAILEESLKLNSVVAMTAISNSLEVNLIGSVTRQVIRSSHFPVWVIRAQSSHQ